MIPVIAAAVSGASSLIGSVVDAVKSAKPAPKKELNQQDFLNLLSKQLSAQDPLKPYDSSSMLQQMANLTSLSANESLKNAVQSLQDSLGNAQLMQASQLVGRQVHINSPSSSLTTEGLKGSIQLDQAASNVTVAIKNTAGVVVKTLNLGNGVSGNLDFNWNGIGDDGKSNPPGNYMIAASGTVQGQGTALPTTGSFKVQSINLGTQGKGIQLNLENIGVTDFTKVLKIS